MNAKELMIGDLVNIYVFPNENPQKEDLFPARISTIITPLPSEDSGEHFECQFVATDGGIGCASRPIETCLPIPITEDILDRNGFNRIKCINKLANPTYFYRLTITENNDDKTYDTWLLEADNRGDVFIIDGDFERDEMLQGEVMNYKAKYVHELQHIMRLLKFPKDIEL